MKATPIIYQYQQDDINYDISFLYKNGYQMINATEMAKPFNKRPNDWLSLRFTKEFIKVLIATRKNCSVDNLIVTRAGGLGGGGETWLHEDLALEFARWLSPRFAIWCNDKIKELLKNGYVYLRTAIPNELQEHIYHDVQKENSKAIAMKNYGIEKNRQRIINHFRNISYKLVGIYPNQIISWGKKNGVPLSVVNKGSREVLRYISSSATACMSLLENIIASNPNMTDNNVDELMPYVVELEPFFKKMIEIGHINSEELKKIRAYERLRNEINER